MFRLLIVDDEPIAVESLYDLFKEYKQHEIEVYKAYSSAEALSILEMKKMDVVLTDIRMPGMDGMQLLEAINSSWRDCRVVFLTGYRDFDSVYSAIQHSHVKYLLKTEGYDIVITMIEQVFNDIVKGLKDEELIGKAREQMEKAIPLLQKEFLTEIADGSRQEYTQRELNELKLPIEADAPVILCLGRFDEPPACSGGGGIATFYYAVRIAAEKYLAPIGCNVSFLYKGSYIVWLLQPTEPAEGGAGGTRHRMSVLKGAFESVQAVCRESLGVSLPLALAGEALPWGEIPEKMANLQAILNAGMGTNMEIVLADGEFYNSVSGRLFSTGKAGQKLQSRLKRLDALDACLEQGRRDDFFSFLEELKSDLRECIAGGGSLACEAYGALSCMLLSYINRSNSGEKIFSGYSVGEIMQVDRFASPEEAFRFYGRLAREIFGIQNDNHEIRSTGIVKQTIQYIQDHLDADLSLDRLAEMAYFNPKYFSRLFKQVLGVGLSDYIEGVKIDRAKELLSSSPMKINEIASSLGYQSAPYFTRFFKRVVNSSPQEYRNVNRGQERPIVADKR